MVAGQPLDPGLISEDLDALNQGVCNLEKQIENVRAFGMPCVVAVNRFKTDTDRDCFNPGEGKEGRSRRLPNQ